MKIEAGDPSFPSPQSPGPPVPDVAVFARGGIAGAVMLLVACGHPGKPGAAAVAPAADRAVVNLYVWSDYLAPDTAAEFEKQTGIKLRLTYFDSLEQLETKMLTGHSDFDVVVPTGAYIRRQIRSGAYQALDRSKLPNMAGLDPQLMTQAANNDPGNAYGVIYDWGTFGIGYNVAPVEARLSGPPPESWQLLFDPAYASKLQSCGINIIDDPGGVVVLILKYLGRDPTAMTADDLAAAEKVLMSIRPYVRTIDTETEIDALANGDTCITLGYNGDVVQARKRARETRNGVRIAYLLPREGSLLWLDLLAIPKDAPHPDNAYKLINFMLEPAVTARRTNIVGYANAVPASTPLLDPQIAGDPAIYPTAEQRRRLTLTPEISPDSMRVITRLWQKFKTGQ
jgi:putrescine transport system substrate-binding protein